jgi:hypothetical protein
MQALGDVLDDDFLVLGVAEHLEEFRFGGNIAGAEGTQDNTHDTLCVKNVAGEVGVLDARINVEGQNFLLQPFDYLKRLIIGFQDQSFIDEQPAAGFPQRRKIGGVVGVESRSILLAGAIATQQFLIEENADFWYQRHPRCLGVGEHNGGDHVLLAIVAGVEQKSHLGAGQNHRFLQIDQHEAERRGRIDHAVGAVQDDEALVLIVVLLDDGGHHPPFFGADIATVQRLVEGIGIDTKADEGVMVRKELRRPLDILVPFDHHLRAVGIIGIHGHGADSAAGVDYQHALATVLPQASPDFLLASGV